MPRITTVMRITRMDREMGMGPMGIDTGQRTHIKAAINAQAVILNRAERFMNIASKFYLG